MAVPLNATLAASIYQVRLAEADPGALTRAAELLARAAGQEPATWDLDGDDLRVNGTPLAPGAPGVPTVRTALRHHRISRLAIPAEVRTPQWAELATILAAAPGMYETPERFAHAVQMAIPGAIVVPTISTLASEALREATIQWYESPELPTEEPSSDSMLLSQGTERSALSATLDPLLHRGAAAAGRSDWEGLMTVMQALDTLVATSDDATRMIVAQEQRRMVPPATLDEMVRQLPDAGLGSVVARAIIATGRRGADALLEALADRPTRIAHRVYLETLIQTRDADGLLLGMLTTNATEQLCDVLTVIGRRGMADAVPEVSGLLRHPQADVRTAAWRALEQIGTPETLAALH